MYCNSLDKVGGELAEKPYPEFYAAFAIQKLGHCSPSAADIQNATFSSNNFNAEFFLLHAVRYLWTARTHKKPVKCFFKWSLSDCCKRVVLPRFQVPSRKTLSILVLIITRRMGRTWWDGLVVEFAVSLSLLTWTRKVIFCFKNNCADHLNHRHGRQGCSPEPCHDHFFPNLWKILLPGKGLLPTEKNRETIFFATTWQSQLLNF